MTIVAVNGGGNTPQGVENGDDLLIGGYTNFEPALNGDDHTGPHCYLSYQLSRADGPDTLTSDVTDAGAIAGIVIAATSDNNRVADDAFDFTTEPTAPEADTVGWTTKEVFLSHYNYHPDATVGEVYVASGDVDGATSGYEKCFVADSFSFGVEDGWNTTDDGVLAVDPNNPNTEVDGRDFLIWQRGFGTLEAGETDANGADYSGSHVLYQDVFIPPLDTGAEFWLI